MNTLTDPGLDSIVMFSNSQGHHGSGTLVHITRSLAVFEVYNPYSIVQVSEVLTDLMIRRGERIIYQGQAVVSNIVATGLMSIVSTTLLDAWSDLSGLYPGDGLKEETSRFVKDWRESNRLVPDYRLAISNMRSFLGELSRWLQEAEAGLAEEGNSLKEHELLEAFFDEVEHPVRPEVEGLFTTFEQVAALVAPEELDRHKAFARRELHPLTMCSPFVHRSYTKPLGYAGDYEMVNMMLGESQARAGSAYARIIDSFHVLTAAPLAHRNRIEMLQKRLHEETLRAVEEERPLLILNIGCGPAVEVQRFIRNDDLARFANFTLMDFNEETLHYATAMIQAAKLTAKHQTAVTFVQKSIDELLQDTSHDEQANQHYDFVYCAGLFDYFSDRVCRNLVARFVRWLRPGGLVSVTNVHSDNPNRQVMEHLLEWHLIYRDEQQMAALAPSDCEPIVVLDDTGINLFMDIRKIARI